jgi:hypothetical protein
MARLRFELRPAECPGGTHREPDSYELDAVFGYAGGQPIPLGTTVLAITLSCLDVAVIGIIAYLSCRARLSMPRLSAGQSLSSRIHLTKENQELDLAVLWTA